jgi:signal transduction histidine kinase
MRNIYLNHQNKKFYPFLVLISLFFLGFTVSCAPKGKIPPKAVKGVLDLREWIVVSITDSGTGIADDLQPKVFAPFFTTKSLGEGIGLGLYVCKKIVHDHGGALFFRSGDGSTEFVVVLPG